MAPASTAAHEVSRPSIGVARDGRSDATLDPEVLAGTFVLSLAEPKFERPGTVPHRGDDSGRPGS
jgi:hypothetical protein